METLRIWMIAVPSVLVFVCFMFFALFVGIALTGSSPIPPWNW